MTEHTWWETFHAEGGRLLDQTKKLIEDGNIRRVVVKYIATLSSNTVTTRMSCATVSSD